MARLQGRPRSLGADRGHKDTDYGQARRDAKYTCDDNGLGPRPDRYVSSCHAETLRKKDLR